MTLFFSISFSDSSSKMHFLIASGITEIQVHISFCCIFKSPVKTEKNSGLFSVKLPELLKGALRSQILKFAHNIPNGVAKVVGT